MGLLFYNVAYVFNTFEIALRHIEQRISGVLYADNFLKIHYSTDSIMRSAKYIC